MRRTVRDMKQPRNNLTERIEIRLDLETLQGLQRQAVRDERSASSVARRLIRAGLKAAEEGAAA